MTENGISMSAKQSVAYGPAVAASGVISINASIASVSNRKRMWRNLQQLKAADISRNGEIMQPHGNNGLAKWLITSWPGLLQLSA